MTETGLCKDPQTAQDDVCKCEVVTDMEGSTGRPSKVPAVLGMTQSGRLLYEMTRNFVLMELHKRDGVNGKPYRLPALEAGNPRPGEAGVAPPEVMRDNRYRAG